MPGTAASAMVVASSHSYNGLRRCRVKTIETVITVLPDGSVQIPPQPELPPGAHRAVLVVEESMERRAAPQPLQLAMLDFSGWLVGSTYRREDLYDDDGR